MKEKIQNIYVIIFSVITMAMATSCEYNDFEPTEWAVDPQLDFSIANVLFNSASSESDVQVTTNYETFSAESTQDWCKISVDTTNIHIVVEPNQSTEVRAGVIHVTVTRGNKSLTKDITVTQMGGIWEVIGNFNLYWSQNVSDSQKEILKNMLDNFVYVEGGTFYMGDNSNSIIYENNKQQTIRNNKHSVTLSPYYISKFEVSQQEWSTIILNNPSKFQGDPNRPVENISWSKAMEFVAKLSKLTNLNISLPTEAQWEYAARGGKYSLNYTYPGSDNYEDVAVFVNPSISESNPSYTTQPRGSKLPNELGIYDMAGNVSEYCMDWMDYYPIDPVTDPTGPDLGYCKSVRGGEFNNISPYFASNFRDCTVSPTFVKEYTGIRLVINIK